MCNHANIGRVVCLTCLMLFLMLIGSHNKIFGQRKPAPSKGSVNDSSVSPVRIAVIPFRNSLARQTSGNEDAAVLGDGISDSLTNALKSVARIIVIDTDSVLKAAEQFPDKELTAKDDDAILIANGLSAQVLVVGSFQLLKDRLHVDARILAVDSAKPIPAQIITLDSAYPEGYASLLNQLAKSIIVKLKIPLTIIETERIQGALGSTRSQKANQLYLRGMQQLRSGTPESLAEAIKYFDEAIGVDSDYAEAYAAKSEAETKLYEMRKAAGNKSDALGKAALNDAQKSVNASPNTGRGHRALARAQSALGDYESAATSARQSMKAWPGDVGVLLDFVKALNNGQLIRSKETDRAFRLLPGIALLVPGLPKIYVRNDSEFTLRLRFTPQQGLPYPLLQVNPHSSRMVPLFPGQVQVLVDYELGQQTYQYEFKANEDYRLIYNGTSFSLGTFTFVNSGSLQLKVRVAGKLNKNVSVRPNGTESIRVSPGLYLIAASILGASKSDHIELTAGQEETIVYKYSARGNVFDPADLTIENEGNRPLTATVRGSIQRTLYVPPGGKTFTLPAGTYSIRLSCGGQTSDAGQYDLKSGDETTISGFSCIIKYITR